MLDVAAVMVNWNGGELAVQSAASVFGQDIRPRLWLVDNGSTDGSDDRIAELAPSPDRLRVIRNPTNYGYARANNQAIDMIGEPDYVLLLNNDVILPQSGGLGNVIRRLENESDCWGGCGRYEYSEGDFQPFYNRLPEAFDLIIHFGILRHIRPLLPAGLLQRYYASDLDFERELDISQPAFSCVLMKGSRLRAVGLFDEQFPIFFNDVDFCWRWRAAGGSWRYFPEWRVIHHKSRTTSKIGPLLSAEMAGSIVRFAAKHYRPATAGLVRAAVTAECVYRKLVHHDYPRGIGEVWRGRLPYSSNNVDLGPKAERTSP